MANTLYAGFGRANVTPPMGIDIRGYYVKRNADGVLDELEANALAVRTNNKTVLFISVDICGLNKVICARFKKEITEKTGVPTDAIFLHGTHTHTGPSLDDDSNRAEIDDLIVEYTQTLQHKVADAALFAINDLKPAKMGYALSQAPGIAFIRRFRMKDGSIKTNPGVGNPDILHPIGEVDERVNVLRFTRENADDIVLANFGDHPDTVGGNKISGDWPAFTRRIFEKAIDNTKCIFLNGAQGDVNHVKVNPTSGDFNDMFNDFDGCSRGYGHARHMGQVVAGAIMQVYDKVNYVDVDDIKYVIKDVAVPSNKATPEQLVLAHKYNDLHNAGKDEEIPFKAMDLTTVVAEAARMVKLENGPDEFILPVTAVALGNIALVGLPGEPFTGIGRGIKEAKGWDLILPCCIVNAYEGYYPMKEAYDEGGYESRSSKFKAGVAEILIEESVKILDEFKK